MAVTFSSKSVHAENLKTLIFLFSLGERPENEKKIIVVIRICANLHGVNMQSNLWLTYDYVRLQSLWPLFTSNLTNSSGNHF